MSSRYKKNNKKVMQSFSMIMQFGLNMIVPILFCTFIGVYVGEKLDMAWITVLLFFMGALAGFTNIFRMAKGIYQENGSERKAEIKGGKDAEKIEENK